MATENFLAGKMLGLIISPTLAHKLTDLRNNLEAVVQLLFLLIFKTKLQRKIVNSP